MTFNEEIFRRTRVPQRLCAVSAVKISSFFPVSVRISFGGEKIEKDNFACTRFYFVIGYRDSERRLCLRHSRESWAND